jgi:hypothetical protein
MDFKAASNNDVFARNGADSQLVKSDDFVLPLQPGAIRAVGIQRSDDEPDPGSWRSEEESLDQSHIRLSQTFRPRYGRTEQR